MTCLNPLLGEWCLTVYQFVKDSLMKLQLLFAPLPLFLIGCGSHRNEAEEQLLAHTWAPSADSCGSDFLKFTPEALEVHHPGSAASALQVVTLTTADGFPNNVMVVAGPNPPGTPGDVPKEALVAFVLEITDGRMKLVGGGAPEHLTRSTPDNPNVERFNRVACT